VSSDGYSQSFSFGSIERHGIVGGLRVSQAAVLVTAAAVAVVVVRTMPAGRGLGLGILLIAAGCVVAFLPVAGRTVEQWIPVVASWLLLSLRDGRTYRSSMPARGFVAALDGSGLRADAELPDALSGCEILSVPVDDGHAIGVFSDTALRALTAVLAVRVRAFGLLSEADQERRLDRWGRVVARLARNDGLVRRLCVLERTVPSDGDEMQRFLLEARDRALPPAERTVRSYEALLQSAGDVTQDHELFVALQVDERRASRRTRPHRSNEATSGREVACRVLVRELLALASRFDPADVVVEGALSPRMLSRAIRLAYDPYGRERLNRLAVVAPETADAEPSPWGPLAAETAWDTYRTDSAVHRTYWIAQWPRLAVGPAFLAPLLLNGQVVRSVGVTLEPVAPDRARRAVEAAVTSEEADEQLRAERGFRTTARRLKQHQAIVRRERELADGHQEVRFAGYVTVSAHDLEELETACDQVEQTAHQAYLDLQPLWGQQDVGFTQGALPIARGLRPANPLGGA
jgi:hypothetical protein